MTCEQILSDLIANINTNTGILEYTVVFAIHMVEARQMSHFYTLTNAVVEPCSEKGFVKGNQSCASLPREQDVCFRLLQQAQ